MISRIFCYAFEILIATKHKTKNCLIGLLIFKAIFYIFYLPFL